LCLTCKQHTIQQWIPPAYIREQDSSRTCISRLPRTGSTSYALQLPSDSQSNLEHLQPTHQNPTPQERIPKITISTLPASTSHAPLHSTVPSVPALGPSRQPSTPRSATHTAARSEALAPADSQFAVWPMRVSHVGAVTHAGGQRDERRIIRRDRGVGRE
jgi:hypothetical protein